MISRRDKLLNYPWQQQRYEQHVQKVRSAKPAVDMRTPPVYNHVLTKPKKVQHQKERLQQIEMENVRLLQKLGDIMKTKRLENIWTQPRPNFLNREKLFETRPQSSLPRILEIYGPHSGQQRPPTQYTKLAERCPTCKGSPVRSEIRIPEERIPWAPPRQSLNVKYRNQIVPKKCMHCGHPKTKPSSANY